MVRIGILLVCIILLGTILRYSNLSPFTIYPDSFQSLHVAENINFSENFIKLIDKKAPLIAE